MKLPIFPTTPPPQALLKVYAVIKSELFQKLFNATIISIVIIVAAVFRLTAFGDNYLSIGTIDTGVYLEAMQPSILSWDFLSSGRPPTVPLLYKLLQPADSYKLNTISEPALTSTPRNMKLQPGFDRVVFAQILISILGWGALAWVIYWHFHHLVTRLLGALFILSFGLSPQLAEWDHVLFSESLSFSLFALMLAITILASQRLNNSHSQKNIINWGIVIGWLACITAWTFTRDTNAYLLILTIPMIVTLLLIRKFRKNLPVVPLVTASVYLFILFNVQQISMKASHRWVLPFQSNLIYNIFPYPDRVEYFKNLGMPYAEEMSSLTDLFNGPDYMNKSPEFMQWIYENGHSTYTKFLLDYPLWATKTIYQQLGNLFAENLQPWYTGPRNSRPLNYIIIGDFLHIKSQSIIVIDILLTLAVIASTFVAPDRERIGWAWICLWLLIGEALLFFVSFHGDPRSTTRHVLIAVVPLRLSIWVLSILLFDQTLTLAQYTRNLQKKLTPDNI